MNEKKFKEKLVEFLIEVSKPKKYEVGFVQGNRIINDGLVILGMNATDILGFAKPANERRMRKVKGAQAWFKKMYDNGWRYAGNFEQEGLLSNGFVIMERELPNKTFDAIRKELEILLRDNKNEINTENLTFYTDEGAKRVAVIEKEQIDDYFKNLKPIPESLKEFKPMSGYVGDDMLRAEGKLPSRYAKLEGVKKPREGFESEVNDFIIDAQKEQKTSEQLFFEETGGNAIWRGKETKAFKEWKKKVEL